MAQDQQEIQAISNYLQVLEEQANFLTERQEFFLQTLQGLSITLSTINGLENLPENHEILLPIGNGAFLNANVKDPSKILIAISKEIIMEKTLPDARTYTQKVMDDIQDAHKKIKEQLGQVTKKMDEMKAALEQKLGAGAGGQELPGNESI
jgi:prefoldin alpha subunit